ncbi:type VII secretion protein EccB [Nocardia macrotermitis]|uniref:ESX-3 secretion system ATPase EccB3 n=1 Tax=Nocardia macrotermitis TaxID=2585198 RepID=A0A7K0D9T1_9NOCA|nr:type VII secretion protein EccB [Nocardia macrotermitis]MQY22477.1 ESX-3 secretion system ATPase EccB3 [Nocardia macrotermitis]
MPAQLTTRAQVNGYRFLLQRFDHALVRRDVRMLHDPMRIQYRSFVTGLVLAILVTGGCAILAFLHPQGQVGQAKIISEPGSSALYVLVDNTLHPVLNLASARLITGTNETPASVPEKKLAGLARGPLLGIPGVPAALPGPADHQRSDWTLCDDISTGVKTTVLSGPPRLGPAIREGSGDALLVVNGTATYLLYDGKHARVDMNDTAITTTLGLRGLRPRPISDGLLNATVTVPDLDTPTIARAGTPSDVRGAKVPVGAVIRVDNINNTTLYAVLADGLQPLSPFAAQVLRSAGSMGQTDMMRVAPDAIAGVPIVDELHVDQFPAEPPHILSADDDPVSCVHWTRGTHDPTATLNLLIGKQVPLSSDMHPVALVGEGPDKYADAAYIPPSTGEYVQVTDIAPDSTRREVLFYITDTGVRFGVPDAATAAMLGLSDPKLAPWQIVSRLPTGPMLDRQAALIAHDTLAAASSGPADTPTPPSGRR